MRGRHSRYSKLLTFLIAFSMILSMHVSFAEPTGSDANKVDKWINYFDEDGSKGLIGEKYDPVDTPWEVVAPPKGYEYYAIIVKAGSDKSTSDSSTTPGAIEVGQANLVIRDNIVVGEDIYFTWNDDEEIKYKDISHIIAIFVPIVVEEPDGLLRIIKSVETPGQASEIVDSTEFSFIIEMYDEEAEEWVEIDDSPFMVAGGSSLDLDLPLGKYRVTEESEFGYRLDSENGLEVELTENEPEDSVLFTNVKIPDGSLRITKSVVTPGQASEIVDTTEFSFIVEMYDEDAKEWVEIEDSPVLVAGGSYEDLNLPLGKYRITEESEFGYRLDSDNKLEVILTENEPDDSVLFTNVKIPDGMLTIIKSVVTPGQASEIVDSTEFSFMVEMYDEDAKEWVELEDSPFIVAGGSSLDLDLPLGQYRVTEESKSGYSLIGENGLEVELTENEPEDSVLFENMKIPQGSIEISKLLVDEEDDEITDDSTDFTFKVEMKVEGDEVTNWIEIDESPIMLEGGEFETITGLPLGVYRITEENIPAGYKLHSETDNPQEVTLESDGDVDEVMFTNVRDDDTPPPPELGEIEVTKIVQNRFGNGISSSTRFNFELQMFNDDEEWEKVDEGFILGNGTLTFEDLEDGLYRVREVSINSAYRLFSDNNIEADIVEGSSEEVEFINRLRPPVDDEDEDRPPRRNDDDDDDDTPVVESVTVTPDPTPQAPPVVVIEQQPEPEPEPEIEVVEEVTPQATLPRTGASDPTVFAGFGAAFMALGLYLKKKRF